jgi:Tol biopolymer transport system component
VPVLPAPVARWRSSRCETASGALAVVDLEASTVRELIRPGAYGTYFSYPKWSPDGRLIAFKNQDPLMVSTPLVEQAPRILMAGEKR